MNKIKRYSRERQQILDCLKNDRRLTSQQLSEKTKISLYKVRKHLRMLRENKIVEREASWYNQFSYTWLYKLYCNSLGSDKKC